VTKIWGKAGDFEDFFEKTCREGVVNVLFGEFIRRNLLDGLNIEIFVLICRTI